MRRQLAIFVLALLVLRAAPACGQCFGDCDVSGAVAVNELVLGVNIALDRATLQGCVSLDSDDSGAVAVNELVAAVNNALRGCGFAARYTATVDLDDEGTGEIELFAASSGDAEGTLLIRQPDEGQGQGVSPVGISGRFDLATGSFLVSGSFPGPQGPITVRLSGQLGGGFTLQIGDTTYSGSFANGATRTPTPTGTPSGPVHVIKVGQPVLPFDPEVLEINPGETVMWMWVAGPHSVRSAEVDQTGQPSCTANGLFDSGTRSSGAFSYTFTAPGRYAFHCGVADHCAASESGYIEVRGTPTATPTRTWTRSPTFAVSTSTPTPELIGGVSTRMLGFFSGAVTIGTQNLTGRLQVQVNENGAVALDLSMPVPYIFPNPVQMSVVSPTELLYEFIGPPLVRFTLTLNAQSHLIGRFTYDDPVMPHLPIDYHLTKEP
jgi:plastocyanin